MIYVGMTEGGVTFRGAREEGSNFSAGGERGG